MSWQRMGMPSTLCTRWFHQVGLHHQALGLGFVVEHWLQYISIVHVGIVVDSIVLAQRLYI